MNNLYDTVLLSVLSILLTSCGGYPHYSRLAAPDTTFEMTNKDSVATLVVGENHKHDFVGDMGPLAGTEKVLVPLLKKGRLTKKVLREREEIVMKIFQEGDSIEWKEFSSGTGTREGGVRFEKVSPSSGKFIVRPIVFFFSEKGVVDGYVFNLFLPYTYIEYDKNDEVIYSWKNKGIHTYRISVDSLQNKTTIHEVIYKDKVVLYDLSKETSEVNTENGLLTMGNLKKRTTIIRNSLGKRISKKIAWYDLNGRLTQITEWDYLQNERKREVYKHSPIYLQK